MRNSWMLCLALVVIAACDGPEPESSVNTDPAAPSTIADPPISEAPATDPPVTEPPPSIAPPVEDPPAPEAVRVFAEDRDLGISFTSSPGEPEPTVRLLDFTEWPVEVAGGENVDGVKIFGLEPDGAVLAEPVRVTRRLDVAAFSSLELGPFDVPLLTMLTQDDAGVFSVLDDLTIARVGPDLYMSGSTNQLSPIIVSNENRVIRLGPADGEVPEAPPLADTNVDPTAYLEMLRGVIDVPADQVVVDDDRYLSGEELYELALKVIAGQQGTDDVVIGDVVEGFGLFDDDGVDIAGVELVTELVASEDNEARAERFGVSFPAIPASMLPSTSTLTGDADATISISVWIPALVLPTEEPGDAPPAEPTPDQPAEPRPIPTIVIGQDENGEDIVVELEVSEVCGTTFHQPLDADSLSFIRWEYDAPGLEAGTAIEITGTDGFSQFTRVLNDRTIVVEQGISSYGDYGFPTAGWTDGDTEVSIDPDGSHTVDDREGPPSTTCIS
ncbi:MAG: hypothetical protein AB8G26_09455 [Ilumatobacter sp.]